MTYIRDHIRAARAYEQAEMQRARHYAALGLLADERRARDRSAVHRLAAEIMEAKSAAHYAPPVNQAWCPNAEQHVDGVQCAECTRARLPYLMQRGAL